MSPQVARGRLGAAYDRTVAALVVEDPRIVPFPLDDRPAPDGRTLAAAVAMAGTGKTVFASGPLAIVAGAEYATVRTQIGPTRASVKIVARDGGLVGAGDRAQLLLEDVGVMRGIPGMTVIVPADAPTTEAATHALATQGGPAYLRLTADERPTVTDGSFRLGLAAELRAGSDLTIVALGAMVERALTVAAEFAQVGVSVRVLDLASVKPFDQAAILRAARDTGAVLTAEEHGLPTGIGTLVAAVTAENYPVPVRRVGVPDLFSTADDGADPFDRLGLSFARMRDEAWELLRQRGKVQ